MGDGDGDAIFVGATTGEGVGISGEMDGLLPAGVTDTIGVGLRFSF
jgi:hypothetical protein